MFGGDFSHVNAIRLLTPRRRAVRVGVGSSLPPQCACGGVMQPDDALPL